MFQRRIIAEEELGKKDLGCKEITSLLKSIGLMKVVGLCYENLVKEFILKTTCACNV